MPIVNSFPDYHVTGAVHHYIRIPAYPLNIYYLGTCEVQPDLRIWEYSAEVRNDIAGRMLPGQKTDQGEKADLGMQLSRFSEIAYGWLRLPRGANNGLQVQIGWQGRFGRGSLVFGSKTFELWQVFERSTVAAFRGQQPLGYYWPQVELLQHMPVTLGNQEKQLMLVCEAQGQWIPQASYNSVGANERSWVLYRQDDAMFPAEVLIPQ